MSKTLHMQTTLAVTPQRLFEVITHAQTLTAWFAEYAEVSLAANRYDFWGRYTPENPNQAAGQHPLTIATEERLAYTWQLGGKDTQVNVFLKPQNNLTTLVVKHHIDDGQALEEGIFDFEDFWFFSLENLRRYLDGKGVVRCDFSAPMLGDIHHSLEIDGSAEAVFETFIRPDQLERWIASHASVDLRVGGITDIGWEGYPLKIIELDPNRKISWEGNEGTRTTVVTWELAESGGKTRLTLVHSGFAPNEPNAGLYTGWLNYMTRIKNMVEYGADWQPPLQKVAPQWSWIYAASLNNRQHELITV